MRHSALVLAAAAALSWGCEPPVTEQVAEPAPADTAPPVRQRVAADVFDGCYYQGQRFSVGAVRAQDGVLKKCVDESVWHNVDGFGNLIPEDPSVQDTLTPPDTTATAAATG